MCAQIEQHIMDVGLEKDLQESVSKIFRDRWDKMHSPLHAAAYMLEPQFRNTIFGREVMHSLPSCSPRIGPVDSRVTDTLVCCRSKQTSGRL